VETANEQTLERAGMAALAPLRDRPPEGLVVDLSQMNYFGSVFLAFLIRCHTLVKRHGGRMVLMGVSEAGREVLHLTALDTLWAIYRDRAEAFGALGIPG
jgi:anti-anti-sigma factor